MAEHHQRICCVQVTTQVLGDQTTGVQKAGQEGRRVRGVFGRGTRRQTRIVQVHPEQLPEFAADRK